MRDFELASFSLLVLSTTVGMGKIATITYKRLADWLALMWGSSYSVTIGWLRCRVSFSLLHSSIQCIRGTRSSKGHTLGILSSIDLVHSEYRFTLAEIVTRQSTINLPLAGPKSSCIFVYIIMRIWGSISKQDIVHTLQNC